MKPPSLAILRSKLSWRALRSKLSLAALRPKLACATAAADRFLFAPARATPLAVLRIGLALVLLIQAAMVAPALLELYGKAGILQGSLREAVSRSGLPRIGWLIDAAAPLGVGETPIITGTAALYVSALLAMGLGFRTRAASITAWATHLMLMMSANSTNYGADQYANVFLFYLMWMPSGGALSLDRLRRRVFWEEPRPMSRFSLRVVQGHLCISYAAAGIAKAMGRQWWDGDAMWRSLMLPEYRQMDFSFLAHHPWLAAVLGWSVLLVEIAYPILVWPRRTRRPWVLASVAMHLGIVFFMGLTIFGLIMIVFTVAAFWVSPEPKPPPVS